MNVKHTLKNSCLFKISTKAKLYEILLPSKDIINIIARKHDLKLQTKVLNEIRDKVIIPIKPKNYKALNTNLKKEYKRQFNASVNEIKILVENSIKEIRREIVQTLIKQGDRNYIEKDKGSKEKPRLVHYPKPNGFLDVIQKRIKKFLSSIETDDYLFSGVKGKSYQGNAKFHLENANSTVVTLDIAKFFPSVKFFHIYKFFKDVMQCEKDVATELTKLLTYNNHLPTGCKMSMHIAYFSHKNLFDRIYKASEKHGCKFSLWVDDITISGTKSTFVKRFIEKIMSTSDLSIKHEKTKIFKPHHNKFITGMVITSKGKTPLRNRSKKKIRKLSNVKEKSSNELRQLEGCLNEAKQVDPNYANYASKNMHHLI